MTVKDLIKLLNKQPSDFQVVLSKDSEGNGFSPVSVYAIGFYLPEDVSHGDFTDISCTTFDKDQIHASHLDSCAPYYFHRYCPMEKAQDAIALYPAQ